MNSRSDTFNINGLHFMLEFYPRNRPTDSQNDHEYACLKLNILKLKLNTSSISIVFSLKLKEIKEM